jgi:hypothetical protein
MSPRPHQASQEPVGKTTGSQSAHLASTGLDVEDEVSEPDHPASGRRHLRRVAHSGQVLRGKLKRALMWLVHRAARVVAPGPLRHFDVAP